MAPEKARKFESYRDAGEPQYPPRLDPGSASQRMWPTAVRLASRQRSNPVGAGLVGVGAAMLIVGPASAQPATNPTPATSARPATAASDPAVCDRGPWGARVQGKPVTFDAGDRGGDHLWHDTTGFHLRVTHRGDDRAVYSGTLHSQDAMWIDPFHLEGADYVTLSADRRTLTFRVADYGHIHGVDFHAGCSPTLTVADLRVGAGPLPANRVNLGATLRHPEQVPFTVDRRA